MIRFALIAALALCGGCVAPTRSNDPRHDVRQDLERHELAQRVARLERTAAQAEGVSQALKARDERTARIEEAVRKLLEAQRASAQQPARKVKPTK